MTGETGECRFNARMEHYSSLDPPVKVQEVRNAEEGLLNALQHGPVASSIRSRSYLFEFYYSGVINSWGCGVEADHAVLVVGYGFDEIQEVPYYLIKNSWGEHWG